MPVLCLLLTAAPAGAQFKFREPTNRQDPNALSQFHEKVLWSQFLDSRHLGNFSLEGTLAYRPARSGSLTYQCRLEGDWRSGSRQTRILLVGEDGIQVEREVSLPFPEGTVTPLDESILEDLPFTWADLLMPWLQWNQVEYLGPDRYLGRPVHRFQLTSDKADSFPFSVIVSIDEIYAALLKVDFLDSEGRFYKRIRVGGFKRFKDAWMFSELYWEHRSRRESVLLEVTAFQIGQAPSVSD